MRIHCSLRKQKCRLKSTTTNGWRHFGQLEQRKSSVLFPIQSEKSPDSGFFTCDPTNKCIMPSSRGRHKGIIGRGHDLRLGGHIKQYYFAFLRSSSIMVDYIKSFGREQSRQYKQRAVLRSFDVQSLIFCLEGKT